MNPKHLILFWCMLTLEIITDQAKKMFFLHLKYLKIFPMDFIKTIMPSTSLNLHYLILSQQEQIELCQKLFSGNLTSHSEFVHSQ